MMKKQRNYDKRVKNTRILLSDWLILKRMSQVAGVSMSEALHRLIEHQAQLPLLDMEIKPISTFGVTSKPAVRVTGKPAVHVAPVFRIGVHKPMSIITAETAIATNGSKAAAFRIKTKGARYA